MKVGTLTEITDNEVIAIAKEFKEYAEYFRTDNDAPNWDYSRQVNIKHIRYPGDYSGFFNPLRRVYRVFRKFIITPVRIIFKRPLKWTDEIINPINDFKSSIKYSISTLETPKHLPDGVIRNVNILTYLEESGEYIQFVQPSVGLIIADFMIENPSDPYAKKIAKKMLAIQEKYAERVLKGDI